MIKKHPDLLDSCSSKYSEIVDEKAIQNLESAVEKHYEQFLDDFKNNVNSEPPSRVLASIRIQQQTLERYSELFLERKTALMSFYLHRHPQDVATLEKADEKLKERQKILNQSLRETEIFQEKYNSYHNWLDDRLQEVCELANDSDIPFQEKLDLLHEFKHKVEVDGKSQMFNVECNDHSEEAPIEEREGIKHMSQVLEDKRKDLIKQASDWIDQLENTKNALVEINKAYQAAASWLTDLESQKPQHQNCTNDETKSLGAKLDAVIERITKLPVPINAQFTCQMKIDKYEEMLEKKEKENRDKDDKIDNLTNLDEKKTKTIQNLEADVLKKDKENLRLLHKDSKIV